MDGQQNNITYDFSIPVQPIAAAAWRGNFNIPSKNVDIHTAAHVSNKACMKVLEVANRMPESLSLEMVSRQDVWPAIFRSSPPTEHSMALFFFPERRDEDVLDSLIAEAIYTDFAFRAMIGETELLIFPSVQLPKKLHRFLGKHYLWGVYRGQQAAPSHQSDCHIHIQTPKVRQDSCLNSGNRQSFEGCSTISVLSEQSPSTHAAKSDKRGRHLDDAWIHAKPLDELRQKAECRYCGFVSSHGGISRLKAHLGGGIATIHLPGCPKVSPEIKKVMVDWFNEWVKTTKAVWAKGIRGEQSAHDDIRESLHDVAWKHAKPSDAAGNHRTESKFYGLVSFDGGISHHKLNLGVREQKMDMDAWLNASPKIKGEKVKKAKDSKPREVKGFMSEWPNDLTTSRMKKPEEADPQVERRGRPLDDAWKHAKALDAARQKTQCRHCGFVSSYGGISRLKAHLGGGCPQMQLQGCPQVPLEVKTIMEQWFNEWAKTSSAAWTKNSAPAKSYKRERQADNDTWEHAIPLDEMRQATRCKYCGFISKCGGIARLKAHLGGGDPTMQLEGCPNVPDGIRSLMAERTKKCRKKLKSVVSIEPVNVAFQANERTAGNTQWYEKRHHVLQETMDEISNSSLKGSLQKLIYDKNAKVQKMHFEIQSLESHLASMP